ncbi:hypothetical protein [Xanthomarina spongicola]|uniref:DUF4168 domain-containing protein n=1 Tax=Xanthomarina spongicola TaxID=570520 RepID=A0A316DM44_9FLAO|nr:hypothetical protein [Xanthomarina spongicola]PWK19141.1 hypothetical protein LX78_01621 [Xanthomarina spongicola]
MKKVLFLFFACSMMQISAQDLSSMTKSNSSSSSSMIENLAADQVKSLTKKLNLNDAQQEQVSGLVVSQLKSEKFQKMLGSFGASKTMKSEGDSDQTDKIQSTLLSDESFQNGMIPILDEIQMIKMKTYIPK